jgi:hypothetical protein
MKLETMMKFGVVLWLGWAAVCVGLLGFGVWAVYKIVMHVTGG